MAVDDDRSWKTGIKKRKRRVDSIPRQEGHNELPTRHHQHGTPGVLFLYLFVTPLFSSSSSFLTYQPSPFHFPLCFFFQISPLLTSSLLHYVSSVLFFFPPSLYCLADLCLNFFLFHIFLSLFQVSGTLSSHALPTSCPPRLHRLGSTLRWPVL